MKHLISMFNTAFLAVLAIMFTSGCATLPKPDSPDSALIILSMEAELDGLLGKTHRPPDKAVIVKMDENNQAKDEIINSTRSGNYFFFANVIPGTYTIARGVIESKGSSSSSKVGSNVSISTSSSLASAMTFSAEDAQKMMVTVSGNSVVFMGDFTVSGKIKFFPPGAVEATGSSASKTREGEQQALAFMRQTFPDSPWIAVLK